ncbi:interferon-inducible GTPase 5-like isoform X2 [Mercenaria mercenaria]|nr:interferon-inducible GTPase 5-like isoform X2 [Mercenaria mercenaria]
MDQEELSEEHANAIKTAFKIGGLRKLHEYLDSENNKWKTIPLNIAVTGNSGVGKSCFINAFRNVKRGEELFAEEDVVETTKEPTPYQHPQHPNFVFWDLPGVGTGAFPKMEYLKKVKFEKYDFFLILSSQRFTENDHWLAKEVTKAKKRFFFVRTQIDVDVMKRNDLKETEVVEKVRDDCLKKLKADGFCEVESKLFLINNKKSTTYDFDKLTTRLIETFPAEKREALVLSLTVLTKDVIKAKQTALQKRIFLYAIASAAGAAVPVPGIGVAVDIGILFGAATDFKKQFGLDDQTMENNALALDTTVELLKKKLELKSFIISASVKSVTGLCASVAISKGTENVVKFAVPILGSVIAAGLSYAVCVGCLTSLLRAISEDAHTLNEQMMEMLSQSPSISDAFE